MRSARELKDIEARWAVELPKRFAELVDRLPDATHAKLETGVLFAIAHPLLEPSEIVSAADVASDWGIPARVVPLMGDFHDLICLDFRSGSIPKVVALNDAREEVVLNESFDRFLDSLVSEPEEPSDLSRIVSSRIDF